MERLVLKKAQVIEFASQKRDELLLSTKNSLELGLPHMKAVHKRPINVIEQASVGNERESE